jgi:hypothetical protein
VGGQVIAGQPDEHGLAMVMTVGRHSDIAWDFVRQILTRHALDAAPLAPRPRDYRHDPISSRAR